MFKILEFNIHKGASGQRMGSLSEIIVTLGCLLILLVNTSMAQAQTATQMGISLPATAQPGDPITGDLFFSSPAFNSFAAFSFDVQLPADVSLAPGGIQCISSNSFSTGGCTANGTRITVSYVALNDTGIPPFNIGTLNLTIASSAATPQTLSISNVSCIDFSGSTLPCQGVNATINITVPPPSLAINPTTANFSSTNTSQVLTVSNAGTTTLLGGFASLINGTDFTISNDTCSITSTLDPAQSCSITVSYTGTQTSSDTLEVTFSDFSSVTTTASATLFAQSTPTVHVIANDSLGSEDPQDPIAFTVELDSPAPTDAFTVNYSLSGSAIPGDDHDGGASGSLSIPLNQSSATLTIYPLMDDLIEGDETVVFTLESSSDYLIGSPAEATGVIQDNTIIPTLSLLLDNAEIVEDLGIPAELIIQLDYPAPYPGLVVNYRVEGSATPGEDFEALSGTFLMPPNQTQARLNVTAISDLTVENDETVIVSLLSSSDYYLGNVTRQVITILDDDSTIIIPPADPVLTLLGSDTSMAEPDDDGLFTVSLDRVAQLPLTVIYSVSGSASAGSDYQTLPGSLTIQPGQLSGEIPLRILDDDEIEDRETLTVDLQSGSGYLLGDSISATATLDSNDLAQQPIASVLAADPEANESGDTGVFQISLSQAALEPVSVGFDLSGSATNGEDYESLPEQITFMPGETSQTLTVQAIDDDQLESAETVVLSLNEGSGGYQIGSPASATVTIGGDESEAVDALLAFASTPNQREVAGAVGRLCAQRAGDEQFQADCQPLIEAALAGNPETAAVLQAITPDTFASTTDLSLNGIQVQLSNVRGRLLLLRRGTAGMDVDELIVQTDEVALSGQQLRRLLSDGEGGAAGDEDDDSIVNLGQLGVFVSGQVNFGDQDATDNQSGLEFTTDGLTLGVDYRVDDGLVFGGAVTYLRGDNDFDNNGNSLDLDGWGINAYGIYYLTDQTYLDGTIGYGWLNYDQQRGVRYRLNGQQVNQRFDADYDGTHLSMDVGAGYEFIRGAMVLEPVVRLSYVDLEIDSFRERARHQGAGAGWATQVDNQDVQSLTMSMGLRASYVVSLSRGILQPQLDIDWLHEFKDDTRLLTGSFTGAGSSSTNHFELSSNEPDSNYFRLGVGASMLFPSGVTGFFQYNTILGYDNLTDHAISTGIRWEF